MRFISSIALVAAGVCVTLPAPALARQAGDFEYSFGVVQSLSDSVDGRQGSSLNLSSRTGFQFGIDYYLQRKLSVGFDMTWVRPKYGATLVPDDGGDPIDVSYRADIFTGQFNGAYSFIDGPITPFVEASLGWTYFDSNISGSPPIVGCWWDPWWGYVCDGFYSTYNSTSFSYGAAAGLRWDFRRDLSLKGSYRWLEVESDRTVNKPVLEQVTLEIGWRF